MLSAVTSSFSMSSGPVSVLSPPLNNTVHNNHLPQRIQHDEFYKGHPVRCPSLSKKKVTQESPLATADYRIERVMGDTELSYFLPSRESGVNDM